MVRWFYLGRDVGVLLIRVVLYDSICWVWWYRGARVPWRDAANFHKLHVCFSLKKKAWLNKKGKKERKESE